MSLRKLEAVLDELVVHDDIPIGRSPSRTEAERS
jgi:hypothetical protein